MGVDGQWFLEFPGLRIETWNPHFNSLLIRQKKRTKKQILRCAQDDINNFVALPSRSQFEEITNTLRFWRRIAGRGWLAYERAVDFRLVEQGDGVIGFDAATVDADAVGDVAAEAAGDLAADEQVG